MTTLLAKPIVPDKYWIVTDTTGNVGNITVCGTGVNVKLHGENTYYDSTQKITGIVFQSPTITSKNTDIFTQYPTTGRVYNSLWDAKHKLHIYTKQQKSKCYYAAGWYAITVNNQRTVLFCPKYLFIKRYAFAGPFLNKEAAIAQ